MELEGKVALVTGGSRGIGAAIAKRLAAEGAHIALTYVSSATGAERVVREIEAAGGHAISIQSDAADPAAVVTAIDKTVEQFGRLDIMVNNAGVYYGGPFDDLTLEQIDHAIAVNFRAVIVGSQAAARHMQKGGRIISIGSCLGELVPDPYITLYSATKAAVLGLTRGMARDFGPRGITVNVVQPGPIDTDMNPADGEYADHQRARLALGHYGAVEDIAATVAHLAKESGRFITGTAITVDGGHNA